MGAHLSTVHATVAEEFKQRDGGKKGYLVLKEIMAIKTTYGLEICHLGVLHKIDKDWNAEFTLQELQDFVSWAYRQARSQERSMDAGYMVAGVCTLSMYHAMLQDREKFLDWATALFLKGYEPQLLEGPDACQHHYVNRKVIKNMHVLLDAERNLGVDYQTLQSMMQDAAEEQRLLDLDNPGFADLIPEEIVKVFTESITDGIIDLMQTFFQDKAELEDVLDGIEAAGAVTPAKRHVGGHGTAPVTGDRGVVSAITPTTAVHGGSSSSSSGGGSVGRVPQLALHKGLHSAGKLVIS